MASPFLCGHPDMIAHAIKREKVRIREQMRIEHHKMLAEKMLKDGLNITVSNEENISQSENRTRTNSNLKLKKVNLEPKNLSDTAKTVSIGRYCIYSLLINVNI